MRKFSVLSRRWVHQNPWMPLEQQQVLLPSGEQVDWFVIRGKPVAVVLPMLSTGEIVLQKTYKHGAEAILFECCAGIIEENENPLVAAQRELKEETGYTSDTFVSLGSAFANPTGSDVVSFFFLAKNCQKTHEPSLDPSEQIELCVLPDYLSARSFLRDHPCSLSVLSAMTLLGEYQQREG